MKHSRKFFLLLLIAAIAFFSLYKRGEANDTNLNINWNNQSGQKRIETTSLQVPAGKYDPAFKETIGDEIWQTAKDLYKKRAGVSRFMTGDVFSITTSGDKVLSYDLHNYKNRLSGQKISFVKRGKEYQKRISEIKLEIKTVIKYFKIKESLEKDDWQFYELAKERLIWDWGILNRLKPQDEIAFLIKGVFDGDILVNAYGILGFSVKSEDMGNFTMTAFRDYVYGDYFVSGYNVTLSPPGKFRTPIDSGRISSDYGYRKDPFNKRKRFHNGIDILAKKDAPVRAAAAGKIIFAGRKGALGNAIVVDHGDGLKTVYGHLNRFFVSSGSTVQKGEIIAGAGNTGRSTATHLHFTVLQNGKHTDPLSFTYERVWTAPFDINGDFRTLSVKRTLQLDEAMRRRRNMVIKEKNESS